MSSTKVRYGLHGLCIFLLIFLTLGNFVLNSSLFRNSLTVSGHELILKRLTDFYRDTLVGRNFKF